MTGMPAVKGMLNHENIVEGHPKDLKSMKLFLFENGDFFYPLTHSK